MVRCYDVGGEGIGVGTADGKSSETPKDSTCCAETHACLHDV